MVDGGWSNPLDAHERDALAVIPSSCSHNGLKLDTDLQAMWLIRSSPLHGSAGWWLQAEKPRAQWMRVFFLAQQLQYYAELIFLFAVECTVLRYFVVHFV